MPEEDNKMRRANTVATLRRGSPAELMRSKIGAANGEEPEMDYHEGKGSTKSYEGYPKEFFTENLDYKGKIDLILKKKELTLVELAINCNQDKEKFKEYYLNNKIPTSDVLEKLSQVSGYPVSFFKAPPMIDTTKKNHKRNVIIAIILLSITIIMIIIGVLYLINGLVN